MTTIILLLLSVTSLCQTIYMHLLTKRINLLNIILNHVDLREIRHYKVFKERIEEIEHDSKRN